MANFKIGKVVLGSLFKKPATKMYPVIPQEYRERTRGHIRIEEDKCILCGICGRKCPTNAITVERKERIWTIERMQCIQCGECVESCPKKCLFMEPEYTQPSTEKIIDTANVPEAEKPKAAPAKNGEAKEVAAEPAAPTDGEDALKCDEEVCIYCGICVKNCPVDALEVDRKAKIWKVDQDTCITCGVCVEKCPKKCLVIE